MSLNRLPDTLHGLLSLTIADARTLDREQYLPSYSDWHYPSSDGRCLICLAGCVLSSSLGSSPKVDDRPSYHSDGLRLKLEAIDNARCGAWLLAFQQVHAVQVARRTRSRLMQLPAPSFSNFEGWEQFDAHLSSLESILPQLLSIESSGDHLASFEG